MMEFLRKHQVVILWGVLAFFALSIALNFGSSFFVKGAPNDVVVKVDGDDITVREFMIHYNRALAQTRPDVALDKAALQQKQQEVIRDLVQSIVFKRQAEAYGIDVPDAQVVNSIAAIPQFHNSKGAFDPQLYARFLQYQARTPANDFEEEQRQSIAFFKLRWIIQSCIKISDDELNGAYALQGAEFAKAHAVDTGADGKQSRRRSPSEIRELFRQHLQEEKMMWALNQWFMQIGQKLKVKTYLDRLPMEAR